MSHLTDDGWTPPEGMTLIPLCSVPGCEKTKDHEDEHGPIVFNFATMLVDVNKDRLL